MINLLLSDKLIIISKHNLDLIISKSQQNHSVSHNCLLFQTIFSYYFFIYNGMIDMLPQLFAPQIPQMLLIYQFFNNKPNKNINEYPFSSLSTFLTTRNNAWTQSRVSKTNTVGTVHWVQLHSIPPLNAFKSLFPIFIGS